MGKRLKLNNVPAIRALKKEGHDLLDAIAKMGFNRNAVYAELARRLGTTEYSAHFQNMYTERDVVKAVDHLKQMRTDYVAERKRKREERAEKLKALREQPATIVVDLGEDKGTEIVIVEAHVTTHRISFTQKLLAFVGIK